MYPSVNVRRVPAVLIALSILPFCVAALATPAIALPNGYYLQPTKTQQLALVKGSGSRAVLEPIAAYSVCGQAVIGATGASLPLHREYTDDLPFKGAADTRYFVLNTETGKIESGLDEATWKTRVTPLCALTGTDLYAPILPQ
jgi:hypothetical protein